MQLAKQKGILAATSDPRTDADVIMSAATLGHAYSRLAQDKNVLFDIEIDPATFNLIPTAAPRSEDEAAASAKMAFNWQRHVDVVARINNALATPGNDFGRVGGKHTVMVGVTPVYDVNNKIVRIIGGSGDLSPMSHGRYQVDEPAGAAARALHDMALTDKVGYQGRGAYTGFVQGSVKGQPNLFSTYRQLASRPPVMAGDKSRPRRWLPLKDPTVPWNLGAPIGTGPSQRYWGMIGDNSVQDCNCRADSLKALGMYFQDQDTARFPKRDPSPDDIYGYTHGMIQAIYDVRWRKSGTPYEIAVGSKTTKLASCLPCALFMEANGFPASATHLGRGESWCPLYPESPDPAHSQNIARKACNDNWAEYCKKILMRGKACLGGHIQPTHADSLAKLTAYLGTNPDPYVCASLILDAVTIHDSEVNRLWRTLA